MLHFVDYAAGARRRLDPQPPNSRPSASRLASMAGSYDERGRTSSASARGRRDNRARSMTHGQPACNQKFNAIQGVKYPDAMG